MRNERLMTITRVSGAGASMTALYEGRAYNDKPYVYFYLHCDDGPTIRVQLWEISVGEFFKSVGYDEIKGRRIEFEGRLSGTYDDVPTVQTELKNIEVGPFGI